VNATISAPELVLENNSGQLLMNEYIVATTLGNCTVYDTVNVLIEPLPVLTVDMPDGQCFAGNALDFSASGNFQSDAIFTWQFGQFANPQQTNTASPQDVNFLTPGMHIVQVMVETWGCRSPVYIDSVEIYEMPQAQFSATNVEGCPPLRPEFQNTSSGFGNDTYTWEMGDGTTLNGQTPDYSYTSSGQHTVTLTVETAQGCTARYEMHSLVNVFPVPLAGFTVNPNVLTTAQPLANIIDQSVGAASWEYNLGDGTSSNERSFTHNYLNVGSYDLTQIVTNSYGCKDIATYSLKVEPEMTFYLPNAFTPDEDGTNEVYKCYGLNIEQFRMEIYDRWGELVFESNDIDVGWNGRLFNSFDRPVSQMDVYAVVVYVRDSMENPPRRINHRVTLVH
jgi:gliding motility-associated-like protein